MANGQPTAAQLPNIPAVGVFAPQRGNVDYFIYPLVVAVLPFGATGIATINQQISADSDFFWNATTFQVDLTTAAQTAGTRVVPAVTVQINDQGSNRNLFNTPVPIAAIAGFGDEPYRLVHPRLFTRATSISATFVNYSASEDYTNLYVLLHGFKVYGTP